MIITTGNLSTESLKDEVVIVTGAGRGIGFETAKALLWLGARVVIAEINEENGKRAAHELEKEFGSGKTFFVKTDVGKEEEVIRLKKETIRAFGKVDAIINNATLVSGIMGAVKDKAIEVWDQSYHVNLRGPVLLARTFLPEMIARRHGVFVCVSSSGAAPYMGPYEVFKTAQVELADTIAAEIDESGVYAFTIGPGIVHTPGFVDGGGQVAKYMGITLDELLEINKAHELTPEEAGAGFAAAVALASKYHGQETSSIQVLRDIGVILNAHEEKQVESPIHTKKSMQKTSLDISGLYQAVLKTYIEQLEGWKERNFFERKWIFRDFKKKTWMSVDEMLATLERLGDNLENKSAASEFIDGLRKLSKYYEHQMGLLRGYEKDPDKLEENLAIMDIWIKECSNLISALTN